MEIIISYGWYIEINYKYMILNKFHNTVICQVILHILVSMTLILYNIIASLHDLL